MIADPHFMSKNYECPIVLGEKVDAFGRNTKNGIAVFNEGVIGIRWTNCSSGVVYVVPDGTKYLSAYPTPDMVKMVVIKFGEKVGTPNNAVFLNDNGEEVFVPEIPKRVSKEKWLPKGDLYCFMQSGWSDYPDHIFFFLSIDNTDWVETRYFNYKTMEWDLERYETWRL